MTPQKKSAWRIALAGLIALAVAMGIGRFAFTPLLPMMLHDQTIDLNRGGWLASSNYLGYFLGAVLCAFWRARSPARMIRIGLFSTVLLTLGMGLLHAPTLWLLLRFLSGVTSALVFIYASIWCLQQLAQLHTPALGGIIYCGPGLCIVVTGLSGSGMVAHGWHADSGWLAFGLLAALLCATVWSTFSGEPDQRASHDVHAASSQAGVPSSVPSNIQSTALRQQVRWQLLAYSMAGFGYIITATFLPVIARKALPPGSFWPDFFWPLFGLFVALGAFGATRIPVHFDQRLLLAICYLMQAIGIASSVIFPDAIGFALGSILLGLPFTAISLFAMREARRLQGNHATGLVGWMTAAYGAGQIVGPPLATRLVQATGSFTLPLSIAATALFSGALLYLWLASCAKQPATATPR